MAKTKSPPPEIRFVDENGFLTLEARRWFENHLLLVETQTDATSTDDVVSVVNSLIDKLQVAGLME